MTQLARLRPPPLPSNVSANRAVYSPANRAGISGEARRIRLATSVVVSIASTASASFAARSAPSIASVRPAN
jgi:hypothetical protein